MIYLIIIGIIVVWSIIAWAVSKYRQGIRDRAAHAVLDDFNFEAEKQEILNLVPGILPAPLLNKVTHQKELEIYALRKEYEKQFCPRDHGIMVRRVGHYGTFWGCGNYPRCTYTKNKL
ncbi:MAG: topoisomerase DNA-binding C4 zinc finger domain-containing protein [bacterium]|nr:topoisomerase DNA-binding C4 zinc finger domain-containing protein [bacterium]